MISTFLISNSYSVQLFLFCTARLFTGATCLQTCGTSSRTICVSGKHSILERDKTKFMAFASYYRACVYAGIMLMAHRPSSSDPHRMSHPSRAVGSRLAAVTPVFCNVTHPSLSLGSHTHCACAPYVFAQGIRCVKATAPIFFFLWRLRWK